jgi:Domain of unknown function (DUF4158)
MNHWQATFLGLKQLPRELSGFEIEAFFTFTASERALIKARCGPSLKLGLALQIGFLRMSGRLLDAVRIVPPVLWKHLGSQLGEQAPDLASLRVMYRRRRTLFDHQELACEALGFHPLIEARRRALVRALRRELRQTADRQRLLAYARQWLYDRKLLVMREKDLRAIISSAIRVVCEAICAGRASCACTPRGSLRVTFSSPSRQRFDSCTCSWLSSMAVDV